MSQRIADEIENRRGLVLGLTLAELLLLLLFLLFLLLLALGSQVSLLKDEAESEREKAKRIELTLDSLAPLISELDRKGGLGVTSARDLVTKLGRVESLQEEVTSLQRSKSELVAENAALKSISADSKKIQEFRDAIRAATEINPADPPATLVRAVEVLRWLGPDTTPEQIKSLSEMTADAARKIETVEGERDKYRRQVDNLVRSGNGLTFPSCWTTPDGRTEYMFDITIRDQGLVVSDATPGRANDPQIGLLEPFQRGVVIDERLFKTVTNKVFDWSKGERCRFYAIIRDGTGPTSKQRYKELRKLVEDRFYPLHRPLSSVSSHHEQPPPDQQTLAAPMGGPYIPVPPEGNPNR
jgi:hypothetical protein